MTSPGPVRMLARSGFSVAFVAGAVKGDCDHVRLWQLAGRGVYRMGQRKDGLCLEGPSTGAAVTSVAVAGTRVLWLEYVGGNRREWLLRTATTTSPKPKQVAFEERDVDDPPPILVGRGSECLLPYAVGARVSALGVAGKKLYTWTAPAKPTAITSYGCRVAVYMPGGKVSVLSFAGVPEQSYAFPPGALHFDLAGIGVVVQLPKQVQIRKGSALVKTLTLPPGAAALDFAEGVLLYARGHELRGRRLSDSKDVLLRKAPKPALAALEHNGLTYVIGKKVYSVAWVKLASAFNNG